jgi:hypothetical protein
MYLLPTTDLKEIQKRAERDEIYLYLSGLDSSYESIRSHILLSVDLPSFKTVVVMIQREEARRRGMAGSQVKNSEEHEAQALLVKHYKHPFKKFQNPRPRERSTEEENAAIAINRVIQRLIDGSCTLTFDQPHGSIEVTMERERSIERRRKRAAQDKKGRGVQNIPCIRGSMRKSPSPLQYLMQGKAQPGLAGLVRI